MNQSVQQTYNQEKIFEDIDLVEPSLDDTYIEVLSEDDLSIHSNIQVHRSHKSYRGTQISSNISKKKSKKSYSLTEQQLEDFIYCSTKCILGVWIEKIKKFRILIEELNKKQRIEKIRSFMGDML